MPQERLPVRRLREALRLKDEGFSNRAIARVCKVSNSTVGEYLERARQAGLNWPLPEGMSEATLYQSLFAKKSTSSQSGAVEAWRQPAIALAGIPREVPGWIWEDTIW